jgi:hypothetical protein
MQKESKWTAKYLPVGPDKSNDNAVYNRVDYWMVTPQGQIPCVHYPYYHWLPGHGPWITIIGASKR